MAMIERNNRMSDKKKRYHSSNLMGGFVATVLAIVWLFSNFSCQNSRKTPVSPSPVEYPPTPHNLKATVYDREIILTWEVTDESDIYKYNIFRKDSSKAEVSLIDSSFSREYVDKGLDNGSSYHYQVSSVNGEGIESKRSKLISATPNLYDIIINNNVEYTNSRTVTLTITGPADTRHMKVCNDSLFAGASWEVFATVKTWVLLVGDSKKFVYVLFRDSSDHETSKPVYDSIVLDTKAVIEEVYENTSGNTKATGDSIHFRVITGELDGEASVDIGSVKTGLKLYDDGSNGDNLASDGVYELEYRIPSGLAVNRGLVTAHFTDRAGNIADAVTAPGKVTIQQPPAAVMLYTPTPVGSSLTALNISWSQNTDTDFASYKIFRAKKTGVTSSSTLVTTITTQSTVTYDDTGLRENETYYYKIYVFDEAGLSTGSNEVQGKTKASEPPQAVLLYTPVPDITSINLTWSQNEDINFASYVLFRSKSPGVDSSGQSVGTITTRSETDFRDTGLEENTAYYYRVYVYNKTGLSTGSNEVNSITLVDESPDPVTLFTPISSTQSSLYLTWTQSKDDDFSSYRLFRSEAPGVSKSSYFVKIIMDKTETYFTDTGLEDNTTYYYCLYVYDQGGNATPSNEVSEETAANEVPTPVVLSVPSVVDSTTLRLSWSRNEDEDFNSYRVYRSESSPVDTLVAPIALLNERSPTIYNDIGLEEDNTYYYRVLVFDKGGLSNSSNEVSGIPRK